MTRTTLAICLAALSVSGLLAAAIPAAGPRSAQAATKTYVHSFINGPESPLRVRPYTICRRGQRRHLLQPPALEHLGLEHRLSQGTTVLGAQRRLPNCEHPALSSDRKTIRGRRVYTCLRPLLPGEVKICLP